MTVQAGFSAACQGLLMGLLFLPDSGVKRRNVSRFEFGVVAAILHRQIVSCLISSFTKSSSCWRPFRSPVRGGFPRARDQGGSPISVNLSPLG